MSNRNAAGEYVLDPYDATDIGGVLIGNADHFGAQLLRLIAKADLGNRELLRQGFPRVVEAYEAWFNGGVDLVRERYLPGHPVMEDRFAALAKALDFDNLCPTCGKRVGKLTDGLSYREFRISGMCQACQDSTFREQPEVHDVGPSDAEIATLQRAHDDEQRREHEVGGPEGGDDGPG